MVMVARRDAVAKEGASCDYDTWQCLVDCSFHSRTDFGAYTARISSFASPAAILGTLCRHSNLSPPYHAVQPQAKRRSNDDPLSKRHLHKSSFVMTAEAHKRELALPEHSLSRI